MFPDISDIWYPTSEIPSIWQTPKNSGYLQTNQSHASQVQTHTPQIIWWSPVGWPENGDPFNPKIIEQYAHDIKLVTNLGVQVAIVIGGGNIYRGMNEADSGIERAHGDYMGMLATVINAMAMQAMLEK